MVSNAIRGLTAAVLILAASHVPAYDSSPMSSGGASQSATVLETMDSGGYTYMKLEQGDRQFWAAASKTQVAEGDSVQFIEDMRLQSFTSNSLKRTFDELVFIRQISGASVAPASGHQLSSAPAAAVPAGPIAKAEGGYTVAEVFARKDELKGQVIKVRGKVVKVSPAIMGNNWVHLKDGSGSQGTDKIIFRSTDKLAAVGSIVTAEGTVDTDKDFGYGYRYDVLVDNSTFTE